MSRLKGKSTSPEYTKLVMGPSLCFCGVGQPICSAVQRRGNFHSTLGAKPESPENCQYVCQPGSCLSKMPISLVARGIPAVCRDTSCTVTVLGWPPPAKGEPVPAEPAPKPVGAANATDAAVGSSVVKLRKSFITALNIKEPQKPCGRLR